MVNRFGLTRSVEVAVAETSALAEGMSTTAEEYGHRKAAAKTRLGSPFSRKAWKKSLAQIKPIKPLVLDTRQGEDSAKNLVKKQANRCADLAADNGLETGPSKNSSSVLL